MIKKIKNPTLEIYLNHLILILYRIMWKDDEIQQLKIVKFVR